MLRFGRYRSGSCWIGMSWHVKDFSEPLILVVGDEILRTDKVCHLASLAIPPGTYMPPYQRVSHGQPALLKAASCFQPSLYLLPISRSNSNCPIKCSVLLESQECEVMALVASIVQFSALSQIPVLDFLNFTKIFLLGPSPTHATRFIILVACLPILWRCGLFTQSTNTKF
ncbi:hypothetical protein K469DRAFT_218896 [Zopfia rhizophila CBS 207.26]|uniref:Uncharacterized protein n=1 Tax=Zopfia rhizophila CBS 207.26 TaxID=1314779 RepID=A0A6A6DXM5_9PEZI|nr:hypothetical protein K469DRAFT_218896 [Zopfia rhizophila CBS 207.26]